MNHNIKHSCFAILIGITFFSINIIQTAERKETTLSFFQSKKHEKDFFKSVGEVEFHDFDYVTGFTEKELESLDEYEGYCLEVKIIAIGLKHYSIKPVLSLLLLGKYSQDIRPWLERCAGETRMKNEMIIQINKLNCFVPEMYQKNQRQCIKEFNQLKEAYLNLSTNGGTTASAKELYKKIRSFGEFKIIQKLKKKN